MEFEIGRCYRHTTDTEIKIIGEVESTQYGKCLVGESNDSFDFQPIGYGEDHAVNYSEITEEEWMKNFSK